MRVGLIVRCDRRGIANQSNEIRRHLRPVKTLYALYGPTWTPYEERLDDVPDARAARWNGHTGLFEDDVLDWFLDGVDVLVGVETFADWRIVTRARQRGIGTLVHANPEFATWTVDSSIPAPTLVALPTTWRMDRLPGAIHLPMPVSADRLPFTHRTQARRFVHVVGHRAIHERAGTDLLVDALWKVKPPAEVVIRTRQPLQGHPARLLPHLRGVEVVVDDVDEAAQLYDGADVLIHPRKYGGLSLTMQEAMALGLAVIATDRIPENEVLPAAALVPTASQRPMRCQVGRIYMDLADPKVLGRKIAELAESPDLVASLSAASGAWAEAHSWERLLPRWTAALEQAANREQVGVRT